MARTVHKDIWANQLTIVFVGCKHKSLDSIGTKACCNSTNNVISFKAIYLQDKYVHRF